MPASLTARDLTQQVAARQNDPHWSVHQVVEDALLGLQHGQTVDGVLGWMDDLGPQVATVRDPQGQGLGVPLCCAPARTHPELALVLLDALVRRGLDVNAPLATPKNSLDDVTTLIQTANEGGLWSSMTLRLLDHGATPDTWVGDHTLMHLAVLDDPASIPALAQRGVALDQHNLRGVTPLMMAMEDLGREESREAVNLLLAAGADPNVISRGAVWSALLGATMAGDLAMVDALLSAGADPNLTNMKGESPLIKAVAHAPLSPLQPMPRIALAQRLIAAGADVNAMDGTRDTVAARAAGVRTLNKEVLRLLADHGADMETRSTSGHSARSRLENRASRNSEITPEEVQVLVDTAAVRRTLIDMGENPAPAVATSIATSRFRSRL